ncbi:50S ribosomal protein L11 methyltransferase [Rariglobus hedericola]|uniref:Ribosomal protein L11 methyltransferase n=1 Tax=Rariglobus hedericola TaxID=2597822 RepID=A0A556QK14_9BACT|nr:50S ribosomal protein L11 methyltransferase [Rariglobus hedericola]TSJ76995.1 50S ribosomal protein L11 methyltransferase [Rariglobus hedericola]
MSLFEIKAEIPPEAVDAIDEVLLELGVEGWSLLQDVIVKRAWIVGIFENEATGDARWSELLPLIAGIAEPADPERRALADQDWRDSYKAHFKASQFGRLHWVPVWEREKFQPGAGEVVIWLDPGLAFGTGNHETTRLCCERLVALAAKAGALVDDWRVIDAGCGSGILALSAAKLGFRRIAGFDNDPEAVRVSEENAELNGLAGAVEFFTGDLVTGLAGGRQAEVVLANIQADVLMRFVNELTVSVAPGGALVLSGILAIELEKVRAVFAAAVPAWTIESRIMGEWSDLALTRTV